MKRILILVAVLVGVALLTVGCNNTNKEEPQEIQEDGQIEEVVVKEVEAGKGVSIEYDIKYEEDIFGDLSKEQINEIVDGIFEKLSKNDEYKENTDLAIEEIFKEYGITDVNKLEAARNRILISLK